MSFGRNRRGEGFLSNLIIGMIVFSFILSAVALVIVLTYPNYDIGTGENNSHNESDILNVFVNNVSDDIRSTVYNMTESQEESKAAIEDVPRDPITAVWKGIKQAGSVMMTTTRLVYLSSTYLSFIPTIFWGFVVTLIVALFTLAVIEFWWRRRG